MNHHEICLYGTSDKAGFIAKANDGRMFGTGEPMRTFGLNDAFWLGCMDLEGAGCKGAVDVYEPTGQFVATVDVSRRPYLGDLPWRKAPTYVIAMEDILAAAEKENQ